VSATATTNRDAWVRAKEAAELLGVSAYTLRGLARDRRVTVKAVPGAMTLYQRESLERLRASSIIMAKA